MDFLNSGIFTIIAACCLFAGIKALIDWLGTRAEGERKHLVLLFSLLFAANLALLWFLTR
ncbi:MAG: hypothetical protein IJB29_04485 [Mailhella sp.]|nr:hypothetical protein [Mailhella sp.]